MKNMPDFVLNPNPILYLQNDYVVVDFETTNLDKGDALNKDNRLILAVWAVVKGDSITWKHLYDSDGIEYKLGELVDDIENAGFWAAHNTKFEAAWLRRCGYILGSKPSYCTQIGDYILAGNRGWKLSLEAVAQRRGFGGKDSLVSVLIKGGICPTTIPNKWLIRYCYKDVELCNDILKIQRLELRDNGLLPCFWSRNIVTQVLIDLENKGLQLDEKRVLKIYEKYVNQSKEALSKMFTEFGNINFNSPKQLQKLLFEDLKFKPAKDHKGKDMVTPSGGLATSAPALARLTANTKKQQLFLELYSAYSKADDILSKYLTKMVDCCKENNGVLYGQFNQTITDTHRLSSSGKHYKIQLQNIPRMLKPVFKARTEGWNLAEADESQLEYRAAVDMARDEAGAEDIRNKVDVHALTRDVMFPHWMDENKTVQDELRTAAKAYTFKPLYGGASGTDAAQAYFQAFKDKHKGITAWQERSIDEVLRTGKLRIPSGLVFYWPDTSITRSGYITNTTSICNYPVQNFATGELVLLALTLLWYKLQAEGLNTFICNTVHDSIIAEICPGEEQLYEKLAHESLTTDVVVLLKKLYNYDFITPLDAEIKIKPFWSDSQNWQEKYL